MKTLIEVHTMGKYFVAVDLLTNVADQGLSEEEAVRNLMKGLEEHYVLRSDIAVRSQEARENILNKQCKSGTSADLLEDLNQ